jgi:hypothetical protein
LAKQPSFPVYEQERSFLFNDENNFFNTEVDFGGYPPIKEDMTPIHIVDPKDYVQEIDEEARVLNNDEDLSENEGFIASKQNYDVDTFVEHHQQTPLAICEYPFNPLEENIECPLMVEKNLGLRQKHKVENKKISKPKKNRGDKQKNTSESTKNIHRYMTRQVIRALASEDFKEKALEFCAQAGIGYNSVKNYYLSQIERFTSIFLLREHWKVDTFDDSAENRMKMVFRDFSKWFLKEKAIRYILNGKMKNPLKYIHYKNRIMLFYIDNPEFYKSNNRK